MSGKRVLITGASKGIGREVAEQLAAIGHHPIGLARSEPSDFPGEFTAVDLADPVATAAALDDLCKDDDIDAVVNNVGLLRPDTIGSVDLDQLALLYDLNVRTAVQVTQAALPGMTARGWGRIVNISSMVTLGSPARTSYGAAKAALDAFTYIWAGELAPAGITVNSVSPGPTETELFRSGTPVGSARERKLLAGIPLKRFGKPHELAAAVCFLLSENAGYITGQILRVDGGGSIPAA